jgi:hypothetical protein
VGKIAENILIVFYSMAKTCMGVTPQDNEAFNRMTPTLPFIVRCLRRSLLR